MIVDTTQTKVERKLQHPDCCECPECLHEFYNPILIRDDTSTIYPAIRIGFIETPLEECTWTPWEDCPANVKELIDGWHGLWIAIPTRDLCLAAGESDEE